MSGEQVVAAAGTAGALAPAVYTAVIQSMPELREHVPGTSRRT